MYERGEERCKRGILFGTFLANVTQTITFLYCAMRFCREAIYSNVFLNIFFLHVSDERGEG